MIKLKATECYILSIDSRTEKALAKPSAENNAETIYNRIDSKWTKWMKNKKKKTKIEFEQKMKGTKEYLRTQTENDDGSEQRAMSNEQQRQQ